MDEIDFEYADVESQDQGVEGDTVSTATNAHARSDEPITPTSYDDTTTNAYYDERTPEDGNEDGNSEYYEQNLSNHRLE